jgi:putative SOS response-associated peptidase YedK
MCGLFTQHLFWEELHRLADLIGQPRNLAPRYNIAPTNAPRRDGRREADVSLGVQIAPLHHSGVGLL